jgi:transposase-like protein
MDIEREIAEFEAKLAALLAEEAVEKEIAEFEANLAKVLADKAAQEIMAEIEAECEAKAKLPKLQPTVCERNEGGYEAYMLGIKN